MDENNIKKELKIINKIFWESMQEELNKKDFEDGTNITREQRMLRAINLLHYEIEELKSDVKNLQRRMLKKEMN